MAKQFMINVKPKELFELFDLFGGIYKLADICGFQEQTLRKWVRNARLRVVWFGAFKYLEAKDLTKQVIAITPKRDSAFIELSGEDNIEVTIYRGIPKNITSNKSILNTIYLGMDSNNNWTGEFEIVRGNRRTFSSVELKEYSTEALCEELSRRNFEVQLIRK